MPHRGFPVGSLVKNPPANAGEMCSVPGSGRPSGEGNGNPLHSSLACEIPQTVEPGRLQSMGPSSRRRVRQDLATKEEFLIDVFILFTNGTVLYVIASSDVVAILHRTNSNSRIFLCSILL